jgi:predicted nucleotidyltransferase
MESNLTDSILRICKALNNYAVEYMIVGGTAVALHGYFRHSMNVAGIITAKPDLDFWYNPTYKNYFRLLNALEELGQDITEFKKEQTPDPKKSFFRYEVENFTLDFLPELKAALRFKPSFERREIVTINEIDIPFICFEDLILDKQTSARPKDITDIEQLKTKRKKSDE